MGLVLWRSYSATTLDKLGAELGGPFAERSLEEGVQLTIQHFKTLQAQGAWRAAGSDPIEILSLSCVMYAPLCAGCTRAGRLHGRDLDS